MLAKMLIALSLLCALHVVAASSAGGQPPSSPAQGDAAVTRPRITGIAHVQFRVSALPAAREFYGGVLGIPSSGGTARATSARFWVNGRQAIDVASGLPPAEDERLDHLAFATENVERMAAWLKSQGFAVDAVASPATSPCAIARAIRVKDPDGHTIELVEPLSPTGSQLASPRSAPGARPSCRLACGEPSKLYRVGPDGKPLPGPKPPAPISGRVLHAGLTVRDAAAADRFYKTALGFSEIWRGGRTDGVTSWINMRVPEGTDYLEYMLVDGPVSRQQLGVLHHVALLVPDIQAAYELATQRTPEAARAKLAAPQVGRNNRWQLNLYDPDGTRVELMEPFTMR